MVKKNVLKKVVLSSLCVATVLPGLGLQDYSARNVLASDLVSYQNSELENVIGKYSFEGNAMDLSGSNHHGTVSGNISFIDGLNGKAASFNGGNVSLPKEDFSFGSTEDFSVSFWIKASLTDDDVIISNKDWTSGNNRGWLIGIEKDYLLWNWRGSNAGRLDLKNQKKIKVADNRWHHIVVTHDRDGKAKFYKDGVLEHEIDINGKGDINTGLDNNIGADGKGKYGLRNGMLDEMSITQGVITPEQVQNLYNAHKDAAIPQLKEEFYGKLDFVGAEHTVKGSEFNVNLHLRTNNMSDGVEKIKTDIQFDEDKFEFVSGPSGVTSDSEKPGLLHIDVAGSKNFNDTNTIDYQNTKIAELRFKTKVDQGQGTFKVQNSHFYEYGQEYKIGQLESKNHSITIHPKKEIDTNKDGLITISDLLGDELTEKMKKQIAEQAEVKPYKHVVFIGIDGAGVGVHKEAPYFSNSNAKMEPVGDRLNVPALRSIIESGAVSYSAQSVLPSSSSPNWGAMLTGVGYDKHHIDNSDSGKWYYPENTEYPTIFKKIREQMPERKLAAFSNWKNITAGHVEPSLGVETGNGNDAQITQKIKGYIESDKMKDTALLYLQLDELDGVGHNIGFYSPAFYNKITLIDQQIKTIVDALDKQNLRDDTLIVVSTDHGGGTEQPDGTYINQGSHGQDSKLARTVFFAANGRTVARAEDGEKILNGGSTRDAAITVLEGLGLADTKIGDSKLWEGMFAEQNELADAEAPTLSLADQSKGNSKNIVHYDVLLKNQKQDTKALDIKIPLKNIKLKKVNAIQPGVKILSQEMNDGMLHLIIEAERGVREDQAIVKVHTEKHMQKESLTISEAMIATSRGNEVMPNLK
ncbi:LamG-like jellyroll fold domain-containing protein [Domibacillus mangrovi]|uniref:LamG-like jellyroll fold domain-containing protein n=1 Tax=Domibacillus mangrovi TaxID=1714354 RepID=A0A1Q5P354_9BACI|nr:LamG-like jellyroll fold domain-containing protein [Domibacillus mangrovi]OKL36677.1 hypothetical protein BLL40_08030 [Domibacillus mangrovi]